MIYIASIFLPMKKILTLFCCFYSFSAIAQVDTAETQELVPDSLRVVKLNNDVLSYNTVYFKANPNARLIDLIRKIPATLNSENVWIARGDIVTEFLVNYKYFFHNNDNAVIYSVPARIVKQVDFFEDANAQCSYQGFKDNNYDRAIHFVVDSSYFNRLFGQIYLSGGSENKWNGGINVNLFQETRHLNITAISNNVNHNIATHIDLTGSQGYSGIENFGVGNKPIDVLNVFSNNISMFIFDPSIGINTNNNIGISYADKANDDLSYNVNYFFNTTNNITAGSLNRQYIGSDNDGTIYEEASNSNSVVRTHRLKFGSSYRFNAYNNLLFSAGFTSQEIKGNNKVESNVASGYGLLMIQINESSTVERSGIDGYVNLFFITKAKQRPERSFSAHITPRINHQAGETSLEAFVDFLPVSNHLLFESDYFKNDYTIPGRFTYAEPLSEHSKLIVDYTPKIIYGRSYKQIGKFVVDQLNFFKSDSLMSNDFFSFYQQQCIGVSTVYKKNKWDLTAGFYVQYASIHNTDRETDLKNTKQLFNAFPSLNLLYKQSERKNLRIHLTGFTQKPSLTQMEHLIRVINPLNLKAGNPYLQMEWHNKLDVRYTIINKDYNTSWLFYASAEHVHNYIGNHRMNIKNPGGTTTINSMIQPMNFDHSFTASLYAAYSKYITPLLSNIDFGLQYGNAYIPGMIDGSKNITKNNFLALNMRLSSGINEAVDFIISSTSAYNFINYSINKNKSNFFQQNNYALMNIIIAKGLLFNTNFTHNFIWQETSTTGHHVFLWNASIGYKFLYNQAAEIRLTVHDILDKNKNMNYIIADTYTESINTNNIRRYFMLVLLYNL